MSLVKGGQDDVRRVGRSLSLAGFDPVVTATRSRKAPLLPGGDLGPEGGIVEQGFECRNSGPRLGIIDESLARLSKITGLKQIRKVQFGSAPTVSRLQLASQNLRPHGGVNVIP